MPRLPDPAAPGRRLFLAAVFLASACGPPGPRPLSYGGDQCAHCHMTLTDLRLGGEAVTRSGKTYPFDDVLCLALFVRDTVVPPTRLHSLWVTDYLRPGRLLEATGAHYLRLTGLHTPMASGLAAFATAEEADSVRRADPSGGEALTWAQVLAGATAHPPGAVPPPDAS